MLPGMSAAPGSVHLMLPRPTGEGCDGYPETAITTLAL